MNKDHFLYGTIGLLLGLIIGYLATNSINRTMPIRAQSEQPNATANSKAQLPLDHPPTNGGMQADVARTLEQARREPNNFDAQMEAASLYAQIKRHETALEFYGRAYKLKPKDIMVLTSLGNTTFDLGSFQEAERWYEEVLKLRPDDVNVRTDLGLTYYLRQPRDLDKAIAAYRAALSYDPKHEKTLQNLITALIDKGDAEARDYLKQLEQINPNNNALAQFRAQLDKQ